MLMDYKRKHVLKNEKESIPRSHIVNNNCTTAIMGMVTMEKHERCGKK